MKIIKDAHSSSLKRSPSCQIRFESKHMYKPFSFFSHEQSTHFIRIVSCFYRGIFWYFANTSRHTKRPPAYCAQNHLFACCAGLWHILYRRESSPRLCSNVVPLLRTLCCVVTGHFLLSNNRHRVWMWRIYQPARHISLLHTFNKWLKI